MKTLHFLVFLLFPFLAAYGATRDNPMTTNTTDAIRRQIAITVSPSEFGANTTLANNSVAFQAAFNYAMRKNITGSNVTVLIPPGTFTFTAPILLTNCRSITIRGAGMNNTMLRANYAGPVLRTDGFWYSVIENMQFLGAVGHTGAVVEIDGNRAQDYVNFGVQGNRFEGVYFNGSSVVGHGLWMLPVGGSYGQGSENAFINCAFHYFTNAALRITGQNALNNSFDTCNFQGNLQWGVLTEGGNIHMRNCAFQNATAGFGTQRGYDVGITGPASYSRSTFYGIDSESARFMYGGFQAYVEKLAMRGNPVSWTASQAYSLSNCVIPVSFKNGFAYRCVTAGTSSNVEPSWVGVESGTGLVQDGSVTWKLFDEVVVEANKITDSFIQYGRAVGNIGATPAVVEDNVFTRTNFWRSDNFTADTSAFRNARYARNLVVPSQGSNAVPYAFSPGGPREITLDSVSAAQVFTLPTGVQPYITSYPTGIYVGGGGSNIMLAPGGSGNVIVSDRRGLQISDVLFSRAANNYLSIDSIAGVPSTLQSGTFIGYNTGFMSMGYDAYAVSLHDANGRILFGTGLGVFDVGFRRTSAGVLEVNDGSVGGGALRDLVVRKLSTTNILFWGGSNASPVAVLVTDADGNVAEGAIPTGGGSASTNNAGFSQVNATQFATNANTLTLHPQVTNDLAAAMRAELVAAIATNGLATNYMTYSYLTNFIANDTRWTNTTGYPLTLHINARFDMVTAGPVSYCILFLTNVTSGHLVWLRPPTVTNTANNVDFRSATFDLAPNDVFHLVASSNGAGVSVSFTSFGIVKKINSRAVGDTLVVSNLTVGGDLTIGGTAYFADVVTTNPPGATNYSYASSIVVSAHQNVSACVTNIVTGDMNVLMTNTIANTSGNMTLQPNAARTLKLFSNIPFRWITNSTVIIGTNVTLAEGKQTVLCWKIGLSTNSTKCAIVWGAAEQAQ